MGVGFNMQHPPFFYWAEHLLQREPAQQYVVKNFDPLFMDYINNSCGYLRQQMG